MKKVQRKLSKLIAGFSAVIMAFGCGVTSKNGNATVVSDNLFQTPFTLVTVNSRR